MDSGEVLPSEDRMQLMAHEAYLNGLRGSMKDVQIEKFIMNQSV
jgi:hypothetical protein